MATRRFRWTLSLILAASVVLAPTLIRLSGRWLLVDGQCATRADAIVVLAGSATFPERTRWTAELFHRGLATTVLLTNDGRKGPWDSAARRNPLYVERARWALVRQGVPPSAIAVIPSVVHSTRDEAAAIRDYHERNPLESLLVVTSAYHARRAAWIIRETLSVPSPDVRVCPVPVEPLSWWEGAAGWREILNEYAKGIGYWLLY